jgi:Gpi18-like mannosyltransferase
LVRLVFFPIPGYKNDTGTFEYWFNTAASIGPRSFYSFVYATQGWVDYPPFNVYIFWAFGSLSSALSLSGTSFMAYVKLPPNLFDMATAFLIFAFVRKRLTFRMAFLAASFYAFNPAVIFNAAVWGQFDAVYTFFLILSLFLISSSKPKLATVAFMLGVLTKPQSIALAPLLVFLIYRKYNWRGLFTSILTAIATVFAVILPFEWVGGNPVSFLSKIYFGAYGMYQATTINAFNLWGFGGMWQPDTQGFLFVNLYVVGWVMFAAMAVFTLYFVHKRFGVSDEMLVMFAAFVLFFSFFMLPTRMHERYLFPAMSVLALMFPFLKKTRVIYVVLSATLLINQAYVLSFLNQPKFEDQFIQAGDPVVFAVSLINSIAFLYVLMLMLRELWGKRWLAPSPNETQVNASGEGNG